MIPLDFTRVSLFSITTFYLWVCVCVCVDTSAVRACASVCVRVSECMCVRLPVRMSAFASVYMCVCVCDQDCRYSTFYFVLFSLPLSCFVPLTVFILSSIFKT